VEGGWNGSLLFDSAAQPHETQQDATVWQQLPVLEGESVMRMMQYVHSPSDRAPAEAATADQRCLTGLAIPRDLAINSNPSSFLND
jgi:hypothetical protein